VALLREVGIIMCHRKLCMKIEKAKMNMQQKLHGVLTRTKSFEAFLGGLPYFFFTIKVF